MNLFIVFLYIYLDIIIGAAQLCNKTTGPHFDSTDEVIAKALATYCCISIVNVSYYIIYIIYYKLLA